MVEIWLPYGSSEIPVRVPEERLLNILSPQVVGTPCDLVTELKRLVEANNDFVTAVKSARTICIAVGQSSSSSLTASVTKGLIDHLKSVTGPSQSSITVLLSADAPTIDEPLCDDAKVVGHDLASTKVVPIENFKGSFVPSISQSFAESDLAIILGELKPHHFLGRSGLCDIVFPGLASAEAVRNHFSDRKAASAGDLHNERLKIARSIKNLFAVGFLLDAEHSGFRIALGSIDHAINELDDTLRTMCTVTPEKSADIVVMSAGGKPGDESLLRAVETFPQGLAALKRDGALIVAAECPLGHGGTEFHDWSAERKEPRYLEARLRHGFNYNGFKAAFLARTVEAHRVYLVSTIPDHYVEGVFGMKAAATVNSALQSAQRALGSDSTISVIRDASRSIVSQRQPDGSS